MGGTADSDNKRSPEILAFGGGEKVGIAPLTNLTSLAGQERAGSIKKGNSQMMLP